MIGISGISVYAPEDYIDNIAQAEKFGHDAKFVRKRLGPVKLPIVGESMDTSDMALLAFNNLMDEYNVEKSEVEAVIIVTQNPDGEGLPHAAAIMHGKAGLEDSVAAFDISLGCSGYVYGLSVLKGLMVECGMKQAVLITADPYSKVVDRTDRTTSLLFGDAATATLLTNNPKIAIGRPLMSSRGADWKSLFVQDGVVNMNGRAVYDFAREAVPKQIVEYFEKNKIDLNSIDLVALHQGSSAIIDAIKSKFPDHKGKFINNLECHGNTVSSSIPIVLKEHFIDNDQIKNVLISGFGVGLSWATNILRKI
jgi:3-oxoacyl-[acyl-carrier-protein] synthase III